MCLTFVCSVHLFRLSVVRQCAVPCSGTVVDIGCAPVAVLLSYRIALRRRRLGLAIALAGGVFEICRPVNNPPPAE